jgi:flagellar biosynthesis activator protein FlaF
MHQHGAMAYQKVGKQTTSPRDLEADLLSKAASNLQRLRDNWDAAPINDLRTALRFNRRLWSVFMASVTGSDSHLPTDLRQNVANLGIFVAKQTVSVEIEPKPQKLDVLININRQLAAGLRTNPPQE